ncbi:HlyD family secretion protein [uncultured Bilophila sp.]|uniref:HlyD family secretion protein n=1 Tax=uncultured Bilophila sp. TaxID=529385 RepID=UPI00280BBF60|nr:HlyD family secretion protein [uncultured Bilophila sp.]
MSINSLLRWFLTLLIIVIACVFCYIRYNAYFRNPWTRDGMVQAEVVQIAARVSGQVKAVHVRDNQFVKAGDPLFDLDDRSARVAVAQAEANLRQKQAVAQSARDKAGRDERLRRDAPGAISSETFQQVADQLLSAEADVAVAQAQLEQARLDLDFTHIAAPVNGYITNLTVQPGTMSTAYRPLVALINADSFRVDAFFRETQIRDFRPGDPALVTLMTYSNVPLEATVESVGWGIARENGSTGEQLLPSVSPTFEWIRLAQRIPVRLRLGALPKGIELRAGTTASVLVRVHPEDTAASIPPLPTIGQ